MAFSFSAAEIVKTAIGIEKRGYAFYTVMAKETTSAAAREVYKNLAETEKSHIQVFQAILKGVKNFEIPDAFADEYKTYSHALVDTAVFTRDLTKNELASYSGSDITALELGIRAEKDSILFYNNMREVVSPEDQKAVDQIIAEEKSHLQDLYDILKQIGSR